MQVLIIIVEIVIILAVLAFGAFNARKNGLFKSLSQCVIVILSFFASLVITPALSVRLSVAVSSYFVGRIKAGSPEAYELFEASPSAAELFKYFPNIIVAPLVFILIYLSIKLVLELIYHIVYKRLPEELREKLLVFKGAGWLSAVCGLVLGIMSLFIITMPVSGALSLLYSAIDKASLRSEQLGSVTEISADAENDVYIRITNALGAHSLYDSISYFEVDGRHYDLEKELAVTLSFADRLVVLTETETADWGGREAEVIRGLVPGIADSGVYPDIIAELLSTASERWIGGGEFMGVAMPAIINESFSQRLFTVFSETTSKTVVDDLCMVTDLLASFIENKVTALLGKEAISAADLAGIYSTPEKVNDFFMLVSENGHMSELALPLTEFAMTTATAAILSFADTAKRDAILTDIAGKVNEALAAVPGERASTAEELFDTYFRDNGYILPENVLSCVALQFTSRFSESESVTPVDVYNFFGTVANGEYRFAEE